jgi:hypothetical protein
MLAGNAGSGSGRWVVPKRTRLLLLGPRLPTWPLQQVGSYLGLSGRVANPFGKAAHDPERSAHGCKHFALGAYEPALTALGGS